MSWKELFWEAFDDLYKLVVGLYSWIWVEIIKPALWFFVVLIVFAAALTIISVALDFCHFYSFQNQAAWLVALIK